MATASVLALMAAVLPASAQTGRRAAPGEWVGFVSFSTDVGDFRGGFEFESAGGELEGSFQWSGDQQVISGVVSGPDTMPRFDLTSVVLGGAAIPDVSGGGEVELIHAGCERIEGRGVNVDVARLVDMESVVWFAIRDGATTDPTAWFETMDGLRHDVSRIIDGILAGTAIHVGVLDGVADLIVAAEIMASAMARFDGCDDAFYRSIIAAEIQPLLGFLIQDPDVPILEWNRVVLMLVRVGVIGSGSETGSADADDSVLGAFEARLEAAIENEDEIALVLLAGLADMVGWADLARRAQAALDAGA